MLLVSNVQMNTDLAPYTIGKQKDPPAKPQHLSSAGVQLLSPRTPEAVEPQTCIGMYLYWRYCISVVQIKHSKGRRLDHIKRRKGWRWNACAVTYRLPTGLEMSWLLMLFFFSKFQLWITCCTWILAFKRNQTPKPYSFPQNCKKKKP